MISLSRRSILTAAGAPLLLRGASPSDGRRFRTFFMSWGNTTQPEFYRFLDEVRPEVVQAGFYGPMFHGYADNPASTGYMMRLPVSGQREALAAQRKVNEEIHRRGLKVVAHFQMINVIQKGGGHENNFAEFYENHWHEDILGPKPHPDWRHLMQEDADGNPIVATHYVDYHGLCLNKPHARQLLRQMLDVALDAGADGIMSNYNYRWLCVCRYCQNEFKQFLSRRHSAVQLKERFAIGDLDSHRFETIAGRIPGLPKPGDPGLDWEATRWAAENFKQRWDGLLVDYGRKRKPGLILGQWNHLGEINAGEERAFTPVEEWGRDEDYFWYSGGYGPTKLTEQKAGDAWLQCLWVREMGGGKPFVMGKYENIRMRNTIAEGIATGGAGMGLQVQFMDPEGFAGASRYLRFFRDQRELYTDRKAWAETGLLFPRAAVWAQRPEAVDAFRTIGRALVNGHALFDIVWDQKITEARLRKYAAIIVPAAEWLPENAIAPLSAFERRGGLVIRETDPDAVLARLASRNLSRATAPWTLRAAGYRRKGGCELHLVNYDRDEAKGAGIRGPAGECPRAARNVSFDLLLPERARVREVSLLSPDDSPAPLAGWKQERDRLRFDVPSVEVYSIVRVRYA
ncbi:MAG: hypothetical protein IPM24_06830 [Bryobacterales bacterium]|nr:hypothetical protein [Bryobacterales bacterium]